MAVILGLGIPPLGLLAWIALSGSGRRDYLRSNWVRSGIGLGAGSAAPLVAVAVASAAGLWPDPNPNPIGLGFLFFIGATIGTALVAVGIALVSRRHTRSVGAS